MSVGFDFDLWFLSRSIGRVLGGRDVEGLFIFLGGARGRGEMRGWNGERKERGGRPLHRLVLWHCHMAIFPPRPTKHHVWAGDGGDGGYGGTGTWNSSGPGREIPVDTSGIWYLSGIDLL